MPDSQAMPLVVSFTLTVDEFLGGQRLFNQLFARPSARFCYRHAISIGVLLLIEALVCFAFRWSTLLCLLLVLWGVSLILNRTILGPNRVKKEFAQYPDHATGRDMEFAEERILVQTSHGKSEMNWERFSRFAETDKLFVLFAPPRFLITLPKRAFSANQVEQLREILSRKLPNQGPNLRRNLTSDSDPR